MSDMIEEEDEVDIEEIDEIMWAVLWDTKPDNGPRERFFCERNGARGQALFQTALFPTKLGAKSYIMDNFQWCMSRKLRGPPMNARMPEPCRVRVRITVEPQIKPGRGDQRQNETGE